MIFCSPLWKTNVVAVMLLQIHLTWTIIIARLIGGCISYCVYPYKLFSIFIFILFFGYTFEWCSLLCAVRMGTSIIGADSMGAMGDRPHGQKVMGAMPSCRPYSNHVIFWNSKMYSKNTNLSLCQWDKNGIRNLPGTSKGTPGDAKCVTKIVGGGGGQK